MQKEMKPKINISFSGGRTSFVMTDILLSQWADDCDMAVLFANTSLEHPATYDCIHAADNHWGGVVTWLEAEFHEAGKGVTHRVVTYETAKRKGEVFEAFIQKHGIPNAATPSCTSRLKRDCMDSYTKSTNRKAPHAVGIRADEIDRISKDYEKGLVVYPLIDMGYTKDMVNAYCRKFEFDLKLPSDGYGNCVGCWKKSDRKLYTIAQKNPEFLDWWVEMGDKYANHYTHNPKTGEPFKCLSPDGTRKFYRNHRTARDIIAESKKITFTPFEDSSQSTIWDELLDVGGACNQGCEVFSDTE